MMFVTESLFGDFFCHVLDFFNVKNRSLSSQIFHQHKLYQMIQTKKTTVDFHDLFLGGAQVKNLNPPKLNLRTFLSYIGYLEVLKVCCI